MLATDEQDALIRECIDAVIRYDFIKQKKLIDR